MTATKKKPTKRTTSRPRRRPSSRGATACTSRPAGRRSPSRRRRCRRRWSTGCSGARASGRVPPTARTGPASRSTTRSTRCSTRPRARCVGPEPTRDGKALDPTGDDTDLVLAWVDRMVRTPNPLVERMTFFWHRHWANSRDVRLADAAAHEPERAAAQVRRPRRQPRRLLPRHGARGLQGPLDAALPERRVQRQGRPERELRPRVHGALHARREPRRSPARRTTARTTSRSSRSRSRAGTSTTRTRTTPRRCSTPAAGSTARSRCSASSATTTPTASSTWC